MELLAEIKDADIGEEAADEKPYGLGRAVRAVVKDASGRMALLHVAGRHYHKLPGGDLEPGESIEEALHRELLEGTGVAVRLVAPIGAILEIRTHHEWMQMTYGFLAEVEEVRGEPIFSRSEQEDGVCLKWMPVRDALASLERDRPTDYAGKFAQKRDHLLLRRALKMEGV